MCRTSFSSYSRSSSYYYRLRITFVKKSHGKHKEIIVWPTNRLLSFHTIRRARQTTSQTHHQCLRVFVAAETFLPRCWKRPIEWQTDTHTHARARHIHTLSLSLCWKGLIKCAFMMGSGAMIYIQIFIKIGSGIQKLIGRIRIYKQHGDVISLLLCFQNKESRLNCFYKINKWINVNNIVY
jgi:hypothetical protein